MSTVLTYDGSFEGLLSCVFEVYEHKITCCTIQKETAPVLDLFSAPKFVPTENEKAARVWKGLGVRTSKHAQHKLFCLYLSELDNMEELFIGYVRYVFESRENIEKDFSNNYVLQVARIERELHREKHRMEAFVRFKLTKDNIYFATIEPDFNVLPLIVSHFKKRYADQQWIIYDLKRCYGVFYDLEKVVDVTIQFDHSPVNASSSVCFEEKEELYQLLWKDYFNSTNIPARKNLRLHLQHVPKRYWKYLTEKQ